MRAENEELVLAELIHNAGGQRRLRADDRQIHLMRFDGVTQGGDIVRRDGEALGNAGDAGIPRRAIELRDLRTLGDFPGERVFPSAPANDQNFHRERDLMTKMPHTC